MKYDIGDIILTISEFESEDHLDIERYISIEYFNKVGIIIKVNSAEEIYTVMIAGIPGKHYIREYLIEKKI